MTAPISGAVVAVLDATARQAGTTLGSSAPAVRDSGIPLASVLIAIGIIAVVAYALWAHHRRSASRSVPSTRDAAPDPAPADGTGLTLLPVQPSPPSASVMPFLVALGEAMIDSGDPVTPVRSSLAKVAAVNGVQDTQIVVLATALIVSVPGDSSPDRGHPHNPGAAARALRLRGLRHRVRHGPLRPGSRRTAALVAPLVTFLPAFWLLIPGALGLVGVAKYLGDERNDGAASLVTAGATMVGIALGVLLGLAAGTRIHSLFTTDRQNQAHHN